MSKYQMIEAIRKQNQSAAINFLSGFDEGSLSTLSEASATNRPPTRSSERVGTTRTIAGGITRLSA